MGKYDLNYFRGSRTLLGLFRGVPKRECPKIVSRDKVLVALWEALEFYADPDTYFAISMIPDRPCGELMEDFEEPNSKDPVWGNVWDTHATPKPGKRAREALNEAIKLLDAENQ